MNGPVASEKNQIGSCVNKPGGGSNLYITIVHVHITSKQLMLPVWFTIYIMWHQENKKIILH
jgi:hypothetical protein